MGDLLTIEQAAERLRTTKRYLYRLVAEGRVQACRIGGRGRLLFRPCDLDACLVSTARAVEAKYE
jgi:excisionase family DNA binding protein